MADVTMAKVADSNNISSYSLKNSSKSNTKEDYFDSYLKSYSSSGSDKDTNVSSGNSSDSDVRVKNDADDENGSDKSNSNKNVSNENVSKSNNDDKKVDSEAETKVDSDKCDDENTVQEIDVSSLLSMLLGCCKDGSIDITKLKSELQKLNIPESSQKVIIDFASKIQDSLKGKSADEFVKLLISNVNKQSASNAHDELVNNIIDVLKSKLNEAKGNEKVETDKNASISSSELDGKISKTIVDTKAAQNGSPKNVLNSAVQDGKDSSVKNDLQDSIKGYNQNTFSENNENFEQDSKNTDTDSKSTDQFLEKLISKDKTDDKFSKVSAFMNQFSNVSTNVQTIKGEVQVINKNSFAADIVKSVQYMQNNNIKELTVKINPKELGEVVIRLSMENNIMKASISAKNKETYALLQSSLGDINNSLDNQNIKIQAFSVNIYDDTTYFGGKGNNQNRHNSEEQQSGNSSNKENTAEIKNESSSVEVDEGKVNMLA